MSRLLSALLPLGLALVLHSPLQAQNTGADAPLESFVQQVARLWLAGDVANLVGLIPADDRILLDTGTGIETATGRHAAAALRALFDERETVDLRTARVTLASPSPPRGFGELAWTFRIRGAPGEQSRSIYVAALREESGWRITELRLIQ